MRLYTVLHRTLDRLFVCTVEDSDALALYRRSISRTHLTFDMLWPLTCLITDTVEILNTFIPRDSSFQWHTWTATVTATATNDNISFQSPSTTFKTYEAKVYDETVHGKMLVVKVLITINDGQIDVNKNTNRLSLEEAEQSVMQPTMSEANNNFHSLLFYH